MTMPLNYSPGSLNRVAGLNLAAFISGARGSGNIVWLLDVIAPSKDLATKVLSNFNKIAKQDQVKIHPLVGRLADAETLKGVMTNVDKAGEVGEAQTFN